MTMNAPALIQREAQLSDAIESIEVALLRHPAADIEGKATCQLFHHFGPGVYVREMRSDPDMFILGHEHNTEHLNVIVAGDLAVMMDGRVLRFNQGDIFISKAGSRKLGYTQRGLTMLTIHPTSETNLDNLELELITKSEAFQKFDMNEARALIKEQEL